MVDYGVVKSKTRPKEKTIDDYSVWVNTDIHEKQDSSFESHLIQYSKNEYIKMIDDKNAELEEQLTDTQIALCDVYEMIGG